MKFTKRFRLTSRDGYILLITLQLLLLFLTLFTSAIVQKIHTQKQSAQIKILTTRLSLLETGLARLKHDSALEYEAILEHEQSQLRVYRHGYDAQIEILGDHSFVYYLKIDLDQHILDVSEVPYD